jgi:MFS family permease
LVFSLPLLNEFFGGVLSGHGRMVAREGTFLRLRMQTRLAAITEAYPRMLWLLAFGSFLNLVGLSFFWPLNNVYIHNHLGRPLTVAGLVLFFHSAGAALGQLAGGWLYDRIGARPVMLAGLFGATILTGLLGFFESWPLYVAVMIGFGFAASLSFPAINALVARAWPGQGRRAFNFLYVANNIGVAAGTALGGFIADRSFAAAFLAASATFLLFALFVLAFVREDRFTAMGAPAPEREAARTEPESPIPWLPLSALFVAFLGCWLIYVQWQGAVSVHMTANGHDLGAYAVLWTLNGLLIFAGQPLISLVVRHIRHSGAQMALGTALYAVAFGTLLTTTAYPIFVLSMVVLTFGEMLIWPAIPAAVARLSPPSKRGTLQGLILAGSTGGRMLGPLLGGMLYDNAGFATLITVMVAGLVVPLLAIAFYARTQPVSAEQSGD